jgi:DNA-binding GntR family transcriptional regulator
VGTQVLDGQISRETKLSSLYDDLVTTGRKPSTQLLSYTIGPIDSHLSNGCDLGDLEADSEFIHLRRLRLADDAPLAILTNYLPAWLEIDKDDLVTNGLYQTLRSRGIHLQVARQSVGARLLDAEEAQLLSERRPAAGLTALRRAYDDSGRLIEIGRHVYRASHYSLDLSLVP